MQESESVIIGLTLIVLSSIGSVLWNLFAKTSHNKQVFLSLSIMGSAVTMLAANVIGISLKIIPNDLPGGFYLVVFIDAILLAATFSCLAIAYKKGELSVVFPVWRIFPLFVYIFSLIFLGEVISLVSTLGIVISVLGVYLMAINRLDFRSLLSPLSSRNSGAFLFAVAAALCTSTSFVLQRYMVPKVSPFLYSLFLQGLGGTIMLLVNKVIFKIESDYIKNEWKKNKKYITMVALIGPMTLVLTLYALYLIPASFAASFSQISIVFGAMVGIIFLKEREMMGKKLLSSFCIFLGIVIIIAGN